MNQQQMDHLAVQGFTRYMRTAELWARPIDGGRYEVCDPYAGTRFEDAEVFESTAINQESQVFDFSLALALLNDDVAVRRRGHVDGCSIRMVSGFAWWHRGGECQSPVTSWSNVDVMAKDWEVAS